MTSRDANIVSCRLCGPEQEFRGSPDDSGMLAGCGRGPANIQNAMIFQMDQEQFACFLSPVEVSVQGAVYTCWINSRHGQAPEPTDCFRSGG